MIIFKYDFYLYEHNTITALQIRKSAWKIGRNKLTAKFRASMIQGEAQESFYLI